MSILTGPLPDTVEVGGHACPINTDFRAGIRFELLALSDRLTPEQMLTDYYGADWPQPYEDAIKAAVWFYRCGETDPPDATVSRQALQTARRSYDFGADADAIYTSFWQAYGIDLRGSPLHWWAFRALLLGLPDGTPFKRRVYYRVGSTDGMSRKEKKAFEERRARYALPERGRIDHRLTLLERDAAMRQYVAERFRDAHGKQNAKG